MDKLSIFYVGIPSQEKNENLFYFFSKLVLIRRRALSSMENSTLVETFEIKTNVKCHCMMKETNFKYFQNL